MRRPMSGRRAGPPPLPITHRLANILVSRHVQQIGLTFGSVIKLPADYRTIADYLRAGHVKISYDPARLARHDAEALYDQSTDTLVFDHPDFVSTAKGRAEAVHEVSHAVADLRRGNTAMRTEEAAAHVAEVWFAMNAGELNEGGYLQNTLSVAADMRRRASQGLPVQATSREINAVRGDMAQLGIENSHYSFNGIRTT